MLRHILEDKPQYEKQVIYKENKIVGLKAATTI